jgi:formamidopyrimidine-DNA glycosylase
MPELPEVETIRRALQQELLGLTLRGLHVKERVHLLKNCSPEELERHLSGRHLTAIRRRGKYLIFDFDGHAMVLHLRMSGRLLLGPAQHTRLILDFSGRRRLYLDDARRFAMLYLAESEHLDELKPLKELGIEPFTPSYTLEAFQGLLSSRQEIKRLLLDQRKIAGLGNIYANEALFEAGIHPQRPADSLSSFEAERLFEAIPSVLERAIAAGGTSIDSYRTPQGEPGRFQENFSVYGCTAEPCRRCSTPIARLNQGGRSSYFCPRCQPLASP